MRAPGRGRILITGSIAGFMPGTFQAVYGGTKAFLNSFSFALRNELQDTGVTLTCLMPGVTETEFFARANMLDTEVGQQEKDDPADVAKAGFDAMLKGEGDVVTGWKNKLQTTMANVTPASLLAERHRKIAEPGSGKHNRAIHENDPGRGRGAGDQRPQPPGQALAGGTSPSRRGAVGPQSRGDRPDHDTRRRDERKRHIVSLPVERHWQSTDFFSPAHLYEYSSRGWHVEAGAAAHHHPTGHDLGQGP
jgi:hypothetical protein